MNVLSVYTYNTNIGTKDVTHAENIFREDKVVYLGNAGDIVYMNNTGIFFSGARNETAIKALQTGMQAQRDNGNEPLACAYNLNKRMIIWSSYLKPDKTKWYTFHGWKFPLEPEIFRTARHNVLTSIVGIGGDIYNVPSALRQLYSFWQSPMISNEYGDKFSSNFSASLLDAYMVGTNGVGLLYAPTLSGFENIRRAAKVDTTKVLDTQGVQVDKLMSMFTKNTTNKYYEDESAFSTNNSNKSKDGWIDNLFTSMPLLAFINDDWESFDHYVQIQNANRIKVTIKRVDQFPFVKMYWENYKLIAEITLTEDDDIQEFEDFMFAQYNLVFDEILCV